MPSAAAAPRHPQRPQARVAEVAALDSGVLWAALALMLVLEGLFPFLSPGGWRRTFERILQLNDGQVRFFGLVSMGCGLVLLWMVL